jgi:hypothetical protein
MGFFCVLVLFLIYIINGYTEINYLEISVFIRIFGLSNKKHIVCDTILKITEEIPKLTPERVEIALQLSKGFLIEYEI